MYSIYINTYIWSDRFKDIRVFIDRYYFKLYLKIDSIFKVFYLYVFEALNIMKINVTIQLRHIITVYYIEFFTFVLEIKLF